MRKYLLITTAGCVVVIGIWYWIGWGSGLEQAQSFSAAEALFSGLAFALLISALLMQSEELKLQREELGENRTVMMDQAKQLALQNQTLVQGNFENSLFQLLRFHGELASNLEWSNFGTDYRGHSCFEHMLKHFIVFNGLEKRGNLATVKMLFILYFGDNVTQLGACFRTLAAAISFIGKSVIPDEHKPFYARIIRAQLSEYEAWMLAFYLISFDDECLGIAKSLGVFQGLGQLPNLNNELRTELAGMLM